MQTSENPSQEGGSTHEPRLQAPAALSVVPLDFAYKTDSRIKLLRISRGQLQSITPSVDPLSMGLYDHMGQRPMKLVLPRVQVSSTFVLL